MEIRRWKYNESTPTEGHGSVHGGTHNHLIRLGDVDDLWLYTHNHPKTLHKALHVACREALADKRRADFND